MYLRLPTSAVGNIRNWPFPYRAGFSLSNDPDNMRFDFFDPFFEFLNTENKTCFGLGLNIEISTSMFHFSEDPETFSFFRGLSNIPNPYSSRIDQLINAGVIDGSHGVGAFLLNDSLKKHHLEIFFNEINSYPSSFAIYTNHGGEANKANIGYKDYHLGSLLDSPYYITNRLFDSPIQFIWHDDLYDEPSSSSLKHKIATKFRDERHLLDDASFPDGSTFVGFRRFRNTGAISPNLMNLDSQIKSINWRSLIRKSGGIVLYQHLGVLTKNNRTIFQSTISNVKENQDTILKPFYFLANLYHDQVLWIAKLATFLKYVFARQQLSVHTYNMDLIVLQPRNALKVPNIDFVPLTIYTDKDWNGHVYYGGKKMPFKKNPQDHLGLFSITLLTDSIDEVW